MPLVSLPLIAATVISSTITYIVIHAYKTTLKYRHVRWAGTRHPTWLKLLYHRFKNLFHLQKQYGAFTDEGEACFVPSLLGDRVCLPPHELDWILEQPDNELSNHKALIEGLQLKHTAAEQYVLDSRSHEKVISRDLTRRLGGLTDVIADELSAAIDQEWGTSQEWKEVNPFATFIKVIARTSNRVFLGLPLCRNEKLVHSAIAFATAVVPCANFIRMIPNPLRPVMILLITLRNRKHRRDLAKIIAPEIQRRLAQMNSNPNSTKAAAPFVPHNDFLQWSIDAALKSENPRELDANVLVQRITLVNFAAIHTTTMTATNAFYDLISCPDSVSIVNELRQEIQEVLAQNDNAWTKYAVSQLHKLDSTLKESGRISPLAALMVERHVLKPGGMDTPLSKIHLPQGSVISVPSLAVHHDPSNYANAKEYRPLRFVEMRTSASVAATSPPDNVSTPQPDSRDDDKDYISKPGSNGTKSTANYNLSTTSPSFLTFSHGRHACPGRFFATHELKLMFAYLIQNYDFEVLNERPENVWAGAVGIPPMTRTVKVRRRQGV
ncbi:hypothetical protein PMZ80_004052 [Knufia obscura]|uniref:Cytochrome P450 n=1 Tax=Knufia obscura TaxID=1635080 RepID=A0ABR0RR30_9EURO|nr:hypothetical protein PMZ80_004052 [Knufia obscura]